MVPGQQPGAATPPMGSSQATQPTANRGYEAAAQQGLAVLIKGLEQLLPLYVSGSDQGRDVLSALKLLAKHVPPGSVTPAARRNELDKQQVANTQNAALMQRMAAQKQQPGAQPGGAAGAVPPQAAA